jgi:hypothetical protein
MPRRRIKLDKDIEIELIDNPLPKRTPKHDYTKVREAIVILRDEKSVYIQVRGIPASTLRTFLAREGYNNIIGVRNTKRGVFLYLKKEEKEAE